jgi:hypothetical protein
MDLPNGTQPDYSDRRQFQRFSVDMTIEIFAHGYVVEFPADDLSEAGARIDPCNFEHLRAGDICMLVLPTGDEVPSRVVRCNRSTLRLAFLSPPVAEVQFYLREAGIVDSAAD